METLTNDHRDITRQIANYKLSLNYRLSCCQLSRVTRPTHLLSL